MKKLLTVIGIMISVLATAQPTTDYTRISQGYDWLRGYFRALHVPAGPSPALASRQWPGAGAVYVDSTNHLFYFYSGGTWRTAAGSANSNVGSAMRLAIPNTNNIKTLIARHGIIIDSATSNSLGFSADTTTSGTGLATVGDIDRANANLWNKVGNAGTTAATNFLGTTDSVDLRFRVNNIRAGRITPLGDDYLDSLKAGGIYLGNYAGFNDTADIKNSIAIGSYALRNYASGEPGSGSIAIGHMALYTYVGGVSTGSNVAIGTRSQARNISGYRNVSVGLNSGHSLTTGWKNTFLGTFAGEATTTGDNNDAIGEGSLRNNTVGNGNSALGNNSLYNTSGSIGSISITGGGSGYTSATVTISDPDEPAFGFPSFVQATATATVNAGAVTAITITNRGTGYTDPVTVTISGDGTGATATATIAVPDNNVAAGVSALYNNISGYGNTAIGKSAGATSVIDSLNTFVGHLADRNLASPTTVSMSRSTAIGYNAKVGQSNSMVLGGTGSDQPKVGIGNIAPQDKFHVTGRVRFDSALVFLGTTTANSGFIGSIGSAFIGMPNLNANGSLNPIYMKNASNGSNAAIGIQIDNDLGSLAIFGMQGSNRTSFNADGLVISTSGAGGIKMIPGSNGGYFKIGFGLGTTNDTRIYKDSLFAGLRLGTTADDTARMVYFNTTTKEFTYYTKPFGSGGGGTTYSFSSPLSESAGTVSIADAAADGSTKGAASFVANDFTSSSGNIGIDYTNGLAASGSNKGFLTSADWTTFNGKTSITNGTDNRIITSLAADNTATAESNFTFNASTNAVTILNNALTPYTSSSTNDALRLTGNGAGAIMGLQNTNGGGFTGIEFYNNAGTLALFEGYNNGATGEFRYNNVATSGYFHWLIAGTEALKIANNGRLGIGQATPATLLHIGTAGTSLGGISVTGNTSGTISLLPQAAAGTYNWNWPTTAGSSGQYLTSGGGSSTAMTWTTPPTLASGTYLPTGTAVTSITSVTPNSNTTYSRVGDIVTVSGTLLVNPAAEFINSEFGLSLPIPSDFAASTEGGGAGSLESGTTNNSSVVINMDATNDRASFRFHAPLDGVSIILSFTFSYRITPP